MLVRFASLKAWSLLTAGLFLPVALFAQETADGKFFTQKPEIAAAAGAVAEPKTEKTNANVFKDGPAPSWIWGADQNKK